MVWLLGLAVISVQAAGGPDLQMEVNREALLSKASSEKVRVNAAYLLLTSPDPATRKIILDCLAQSDQTGAHAAVCKALSQTRTESQVLPNPADLIGPLLRLLASPDPAVSRLAAEALLVFGYDRIGPSLEQMVTEPNTPLASRLNGIYALRLQPDKRAAIALLGLVDDPNQQVVSEARESLYAMGIPEGRDKEDRRQIINDLRAKSMEEFMRDWVITQEDRLRKEREQLKQEQARIAAVWRFLRQTQERLYGMLTDDQDRVRFLVENLKGPEAEMRLWALENLYQLRTAGKPVPVEVGAILGATVADPDKRVRLETARLLSITGQLGSPALLLDRMESEPDGQVKTVVLLALGQACDYALGVGALAQVPPEVRQGALEWADRFLWDSDPNRARVGAQVMQRILDKAGVLSATEVDRYLGRLEQRFTQVANPDGGLRVDLLRVMGLLCGPQGGSREMACRRFGPLFEKAYSDQDDKLRELAVEGMIAVDSGQALKRLRQGALNEKNPAIRTRVIELTGQIGGPEDLEWLAGRLSPNNPDLDSAWRAVSLIITRSDLAVASAWLARFKAQDMANRLRDQWRSFLSLLERKAGGQPDLLRQVLQEMAAFHKDRSELEAEAGCLERLRQLTSDAPSSEVDARLLELYLLLGRAQGAAGLLGSILERVDLDQQDRLAQVLARMKALGGRQAGLVQDVIGMVTVKEPRPGWERVKVTLGQQAGPGGQG